MHLEKSESNVCCSRSSLVMDSRASLDSSISAAGFFWSLFCHRVFLPGSPWVSTCWFLAGEVVCTAASNILFTKAPLEAQERWQQENKPGPRLYLGTCFTQEFAGARAQGIYCLRKENPEWEQAAKEWTGTWLQGKARSLLGINSVGLCS